MADWRNIPAKRIDWRRLAHGIAKTGHAGSRLALLCKDSDKPYAKGDWSDLTLGEIADLGIRQWMRAPGIGETGVAVIKSVIDRAAEGEDVTISGPAPDAYIPACERGEEAKHTTGMPASGGSRG